MITYWLIMRAVNDRHLSEILGDNCYYLGFVFTLTSMAITLYLLYGADNMETQDQLPKVISGFGIALSSTIVGIVLRVTMLRMSPGNGEREGEARVDLDLAVRDFRAHLRMSADELKRHSIETSQVLAEQRDAAQQALVQGVETHRKALEASAAALTRFSEETEKRLLEQRTALLEGMDGDVRAYREALDGSAASLRRILDEAAQALSSYRDEAMRAAGLNREAHEQVASAADIARKELEDAKALVESVAVLSRESSGLDAVLARLAGQFEKVEDGIAQNLEPAIGRLGEATTRILSTLEISAGKLRGAAEGFESAAARTKAADVQTNITGAVERLQDANAALAAATGKLDDLLGRRSLWRRMFGSRSR